ncbi:MAG: S24/S26 family peptidase [Clostridia bacterium]|nr:S24/S26 family peptidase [Clostridia bacterium]
MKTVEYLEPIEQQLKNKGSYASITKGCSMQPLFKTRRDMVVIEPLSREPKKYDVVLYRGAGAEYILHRIIKVCPEFFVIRGDNTYVKEFVPKENVIGVLTTFNRKGKRGTTGDFSYILYSRVWNFIYPIRSLYVKLRRLASKIYHKLFG